MLCLRDEATYFRSIPCIYFVNAWYAHTILRLNGVVKLLFRIFLVFSFFVKGE